MRRETLAGVRPGRGREITGTRAGSLLCDDSDKDEGVGDGCSFAGIPWMFIAMAGEISAGSETPAKARRGVDGFRGRLRNQTGSSGGSRLTMLDVIWEYAGISDVARSCGENTTFLSERADGKYKRDLSLGMAMALLRYGVVSVR